MYGNTKVTPAVHGCHGNFIFYQWLYFGYQRETLLMKFEVFVTNFVILTLQGVIFEQAL